MIVFTEMAEFEGLQMFSSTPGKQFYLDSVISDDQWWEWDRSDGKLSSKAKTYL